MAHALRGLGAREVTMLVRGDRVLERMEPFASAMVREALESSGIHVRTGSSATRVARAGSGPVAVTVDDGTTVAADQILVATGRSPATADIGVEVAGLAPGRPIRVDDSLRAVDADGGWLYAVGDANGRNLLTHMGKYQARVCGDVIAARAAGRPDDEPGLRAVADALGAPQVVFTDPAACSVGLTEAAARDRGLAVRAVEYDLGNVSGAYLQADGYTGRAKAVIDVDRNVFVGVTFVGPGVAELLHAATIAVTAGVTLDDLWHAVPAYPTVSEIWLRLLEAARDAE
jgi:dihydrolipoamide dehydrogenase